MACLLFPFFFFFFGHALVCDILFIWPGIEHIPPALEVLTTGPPGKSLLLSLTARFLLTLSLLVFKSIPLYGNKPSPSFFQLQPHLLPFKARILERVFYTKASTSSALNRSPTSHGFCSWPCIGSTPAKVTDDLSPYIPRPGTSLTMPSKCVILHKTQSLCFRDAAFAWFSACFLDNSESFPLSFKYPCFSGSLLTYDTSLWIISSTIMVRVTIYILMIKKILISRGVPWLPNA